MASKRALKVYRTSIGFQDAYVAAPSQKAALEAWGTDKNLFARGAAEVVTDPKLTKAALASPGAVIRVARGTAAEHLAAARTAKRTAAKTAVIDEDVPPAPAPPKRPPHPSRARLTQVERALESREKAQQEKLAELEARIEKLRLERDEVRREGEAALAKLEGQRDTEEEAYRDAIDRWEG